MWYHSWSIVFVKDEKAARGRLVLKSLRMFADSGPVRSKMSKVRRLKPKALGLLADLEAGNEPVW